MANKTVFKKSVPLCLVMILFFGMHPGIGLGQTSAEPGDASQSLEHVTKAIKIRQKSQKQHSQWEKEKTKLVSLYEQLLSQKQALEIENKHLAAQLSAQQQVNNTLSMQKKESIRTARELGPFLDRLAAQLEHLIEADSHFLAQERTSRLAQLKKTLADPGISVAEKYRKTMEALFIEAEYGSTIEVYQEKLRISPEAPQEQLCNIFRLGRVSLFFLSLDETICGVFNPGRSAWEMLSEDQLPAIRSAVEIGSKRRPVELLPLPLGRLAVSGGE